MRSVPVPRSAAPARAVRRLALVAVLATGPLALAAVGPAVAHADDTIASFNAISSGFAFDATLANPQTIPLVSAVEAAGPAAQAHLSSLADSDAFASFPYPGQDVIGLPGLVNALFGVPVPAYPAYASTAFGDKPADKQLPGVTLHAESGESVAVANAVAGAASAANATSTARAQQDGDGVSATSDAAVDGLNIGGVLRISGLQAHTEAARDTSGKLTTTSHLSFGQLTVPGLSLTIPSGTPAQIPLPVPIPFLPQPPPINVPVLPIPLGGSTISAPDIGFEDGSFTVTLPQPSGKPATFAVPAQAVLDSFKAAGIDIAYQAPKALVDSKGATDGIQGAGLTITFVAPEPPAPINSQVHGKTTVVLTLGRATAQVDLAPAPGFGEGGSNGTVSMPSAPANIPSSTPTTDGPVSGGGAGPALGLGTSTGDRPGDLSTGTTDAGSLPPAVAAPAPATATTAALSAAHPLTDSADIYLLLVVGAGAAFGGLQIMRLLGVKHPCGS